MPEVAGVSMARRGWHVWAAAPLLSSSCPAAGVLDPRGPVGAAERLILLNATGIMLVVVVPVILLTLGFAWWYRASNTRAAYRPDWAYSGAVELVVWAIPAMVVILLAGVAWIGSHELDPALKLDSKTAPMRVEVVSLDWKWLFIYPDLNIATLNQLVIPAATPIEFALTSATVMNAFFVPQLGTQIYTMPGMTTHLNLMADLPGDYQGLSSHFSGDGFSDMRFMVHALTAADFEHWRTAARTGKPELKPDVYATLARGGTTAAPPRIYNGVEDGLFEKILQAATAAPAAAVSPEK